MKKFYVASIVMLSMATTAFAEQPKAAEYRKIFESGKYFVEYIPKGGYGQKMGLAVEGNSRAAYTANSFNAASFLPFGGLIKGEAKLEPIAFFKDGKFYQSNNFDTKKFSVATPEQLKDPCLDPKENWFSVPIQLALPEELVPLAPNDAFNSYPRYQPATFVETVEKVKEPEKKGKEAKKKIYDLYTIPFNNLNGSVVYEKNFRYNYDDKGELKSISSYFVINGVKTFLGTMKIIKISSELPEKAFQFKEGTKVYSAGIGDMDDLLDQLPVVENYEAKDEEEEATVKKSRKVGQNG